MVVSADAAPEVRRQRKTSLSQVPPMTSLASGLKMSVWLLARKAAPW